MPYGWETGLVRKLVTFRAPRKRAPPTLKKWEGIAGHASEASGLTYRAPSP